MKLFVFLDLDDSIFQTRRKCPSGEPLLPAAVDREGAPNSWMTMRQRALFDLLQSNGTIIPTTARNWSAFRRVQLPFEHAAILNFGGVVLLPDGRVDDRWDANIRPQAMARREPLQRAFEDVSGFVSEQFPGIYARIIEDFDMPLYLVIKQREPRNEALRIVASSGILPSGPEWLMHYNDNNLSLVPHFLCKEHAVRYVMNHHLGDEPVWTLGIGDSLSDAPFMSLCDHALIPAGSQLAAARVAARGSHNAPPQERGG